MELVGFSYRDNLRLSYRLDAVILGRALSSATFWQAGRLQLLGQRGLVGSSDLGGDVI